MNRCKLTTGVALCAATLSLSTGATAQLSDKWEFGAQLYGYFPSLSGTSTFSGAAGGSDVNVDVDNILDNLEFVFMGSLEARRGRWGAFTDVLYMDIGSSKSGSRDFSIGPGSLPAGAEGDLNYDLKALLWTVAGSYRWVADPGVTSDVFVGVRLADVEQEVDWQVTGNVGSIPTSGRSGSSTNSRSYWDGIIGVKGRVMFGADRRWFLPYYVDIGTGESDLTWQAMTGIGYSWGWGDIVGAWRYVDYDFGSGKPLTDLTLNGPSLAFVFRW